MPAGRAGDQHAAASGGTASARSCRHASDRTNSGVCRILGRLRRIGGCLDSPHRASRSLCAVVLGLPNMPPHVHDRRAHLHRAIAWSRRWWCSRPAPAHSRACGGSDSGASSESKAVSETTTSEGGGSGRAGLPGHDRAQVRHDHDRGGARADRHRRPHRPGLRCWPSASCRSAPPSGLRRHDGAIMPWAEDELTAGRPDAHGRRRRRRRRLREDRCAAPRPDPRRLRRAHGGRLRQAQPDRPDGRPAEGVRRLRRPVGPSRPGSSARRSDAAPRPRRP